MSYLDTKPATNDALVSADVRNNFVAARRASFINFLMDPLFECWPDTDALEPATYSLSGAGATISRHTTAANLGVGSMGANVIRGGADAILDQQLLDTASYDDFFDGLVVTAGVYAKGSAIGAARISIDDGAVITNGATNTQTTVPEWLTVEKTIDAAATKLTLQLEVIAAGNVTWSGATFLFSDIKPARFHLPITKRVEIGWSRPSTLAIEDIAFDYYPDRPFVVGWCQVAARTAPTGQAAIFDLNQWDGATLTSMYSTRPQILDAASPATGGAAPDGTYNRRCLSPYFGSGALAAGNALRASIDQVGSSVAGADASVIMRGKGWLRPMEIFVAGSDLLK